MLRNDIQLEITQDDIVKQADVDFGYPLPEAAQVALQAARETAARLNAVRLIRFVLFDKVTVDAFQHALEDTVR